MFKSVSTVIMRMFIISTASLLMTAMCCSKKKTIPVEYRNEPTRQDYRNLSNAYKQYKEQRIK